MNPVDRVRARLSLLKNYRLQGLAAKYAKNLVTPTFICLKLSERCNSRCIHCDIWFQKTNQEELTTEEWKATLADIRSWAGPVQVVYTGGEVFLRNDAMELIRYGSRLGLVIEVLTNGLTTDRDKCEELVLAGPDQVTLSLDGVTPATHLAIRRIPRMFEKIVQAIDDLDEFQNKHRTGLKILIKMVIMKQNLHEVVAMADWVKERGKANLMVQPIEQNYAQKENLEWYKDSPLWIHDTAGVEQIIQELIERKRNGGPIRNSVENLEAMIDYFRTPDSNMRKTQRHIATQKAHLCMTGVSSLVISANGDVRWCFNMPPAGNVRQAAPRTIWKTRSPCWKTDCGYYL